MHGYSTDSGERRGVPLLLASVATALAWVSSRILAVTHLFVPWWLDAPSSHHGTKRCVTARILDDTHAKAVATDASKRGTTLLSPESVLYPCILHLLGSSEPNRPYGLLDRAFRPPIAAGRYRGELTSSVKE